MALNIANIDKLISALELADPAKFNMKAVFSRNGRDTEFRIARQHDCGTAACLAGWACWVKSPLLARKWNASDAEKWLGLTDIQGDILFEPAGFDQYPQIYPIARAIDVLRHLRDTGIISWESFPASAYQTLPVAPKPAWTPPVVITIEPELPESLTSLLRQPEAAPS